MANSFGSEPLESVGRAVMLAEPYEIPSAGVDRLTDIWRMTGSAGVKRRRELVVALRRFSDAGVRERDDDALIDLMIAAEALFLPGVGDELSFKLSLRAAFSLRRRWVTKAEAFGHMQRAYDARSRIVHGQVVDAVTRADGSVESLNEFVRLTATHLRAALNKAIALAEEGTEPLVDWNGLILHLVIHALKSTRASFRSFSRSILGRSVAGCTVRV